MQIRVVETGLLVIFTIVFLWLGTGVMLDHQIAHPFPVGYLASDTFLHQSTAEGIKELGSYQEFPPYMTGGVENTAGLNPPIFNHLAAAMSQLTGLEVYDTMPLLVFVFLLLSALGMYLVIRRYNKHLALLALPFMFLSYHAVFPLGITFGQWDFYPGMAMFIGFVWLLSVSMKSKYIPLGIFLGGTFLTHPPETFWIIGFSGLYGLLLLVQHRKIPWKYGRTLIYSGIVAAAMTLPYIHLFLVAWLPSRSSTVLRATAFPTQANVGHPIVLVEQLGVWQWFLYAGLIAAVALIVLKWKAIIPLLFGLFSFGIGYTIFIGFDKAMQYRFMWPIALSVLFPLAIFFLAKIFLKKWSILLSIGAAVVLSVLVVLSVQSPLQFGSLVDQTRWDSIQWIADTTPDDSKVLFMYGDAYEQSSLLYNTKRLAFFIDSQRYVQAIQERRISREYEASFASPGSKFPARTSPLTYKIVTFDPEVIPLTAGIMDICQFDYWIFDKVSRQPVLAQYNLLVAQQLVNRNATVAYENDGVLILGNPNPGGDCIEESTF